MTINSLFDSTSALLIKTAQLRTQKAKVIAGNIANVDTPGYKARDFRFAEQLRQAAAGQPGALAMTTTRANHIGGLHPVSAVQGNIGTKTNPLGGLDGNSVNLDQEMADQAINNEAFMQTIQMLKTKMAILKNAIVEGGK
ncbi:MAG: flagellar basal body rod protein FlgB [Deltaproteobacteria bacterium]|nr:flagellar basal body rod protein FlgB [Deltaproteobacteria bacterium]